MHSTLEIDSLSKSYGLRKILSDIYLKCETGEVVGVLGRNGCGKSTLLKIVFGILSADFKTVQIDNTIYQKAYKTKNQLAYLPQHRFLPDNLSLKKIIQIYIQNKNRREQIYNDSRISNHLTKTTKELSGGELRYFEILLLVNLDVKFILLDEPFSNIEPIYIEEIIKLIQQNKSEKGFVITDHDYENIIKASSRIVLIKDGALKNIKEPEQLEEYNYLPIGTFKEKNQKEKESISIQFEVDEQTIHDLNLQFTKYDVSIYSFFNNTKTKGGEAKLRKIFANPTTNRKVLVRRTECIDFFTTEKISLNINKSEIDFIEYYLSLSCPFVNTNLLDIFADKIRNKLSPTNEYINKRIGIENVIEFIKYLSEFSSKYNNRAIPSHLSNLIFTIQDILQEKEFSGILFSSAENYLSEQITFAKLDIFIRKEGTQKIRKLLDILYELDVFESVSKTGIENQFTLPSYSDSEEPNILAKGLFHPLLKDPIKNNFDIGYNNNLCFLSGANMSGKSTFLKSFGVCVYLAHIGFPVPASQFKTSIFNGLITTINLSDNITQGYSHFYSEVKRVKDAANMIKNKKKVVVIFDELFRGTNVKDASDASLVITSALSKIQKSIFLISTHIVEIAEDLKDHKNIFYNQFESKMIQNKPVYSYLLKEGVSKERAGMQIVKNEKIVEILEQAQD